jgi:hypothetical protein
MPEKAHASPGVTLTARQERPRDSKVWFLLRKFRVIVRKGSRPLESKRILSGVRAKPVSIRIARISRKSVIKFIKIVSVKWGNAGFIRINHPS